MTSWGEAQTCSSGIISGRVFRDYNQDGALDPIEEPGVSGVTIVAFTDTATIGQTISNNDGSFTLNVPNVAVRLELTNVPSYLKIGGVGTSSATGVVFPSGCNVNFSLVNNAEYCPTPATLAVPKFSPGDLIIGPRKDGEALYTFSESGGSSGSIVSEYDLPARQSAAKNSEIGTVYGLAYHKLSNTIYAGSFIRRHASLGPSGNPSTIYAINRNSGVVSNFITLDPSRTDPHTGNSDSGDQWQADFGAFSEVFKDGFGDIDISEEDDTLYAVDLKTRALVSIPILSNGSAGAPTSFNIVVAAASSTMASQCVDFSNVFAPGDVRPFGLGVKDGQLYIGVVCSGESRARIELLPVQGPSQASDVVVRPGDRTTLRGYVFKIVGTNLEEVISFPFTYERACQAEEIPNCLNGASADWLPWTDKYPFYDNPGSQFQGHAVWAQPVISDIAFDRDGVILGLNDRWGNQTGPATDSPPYPQNQRPGQRGNLVWSAQSGDILRGCFKSDGTLVMEELISGDSSCGTAGLHNANFSGRPTDEYYFQDDFAENGYRHGEVASGSVVQLPGRSSVISSVFDPIRPVDGAFHDGGVAWYDRNTGSFQKGFRIYDGSGNINSGDFGKASGLGDVEPLCQIPPLEIGNRIWFDQDRDGLQDPSEPPIAGVPVTLINITTNEVLGTVATATDGTYYFGGISIRNLSGPLTPNHNYQLRIPLNAAALNGTVLTTSNSSNDRIDSDGNSSNGFAVVDFNLNGTEGNNHTFDFGFTVLSTPTPTATSTPTPTPTPTITPSPTFTPTVGMIPSPTPTLPRNITPSSPTLTPTPIATNTPLPTATPLKVPIFTPTPTPRSIIPPVNVVPREPPTPNGTLQNLLVAVDSSGHELLSDVNRVLNLQRKLIKKEKCDPIRGYRTTRDLVLNRFVKSIWEKVWGFSVIAQSATGLCQSSVTISNLSEIRSAIDDINQAGVQTINSCKAFSKRGERLKRRLQKSYSKALSAERELNALFKSCT